MYTKRYPKYSESQVAEVGMMRYDKKMSIREISNTTGYPQGTIQHLLKRYGATHDLPKNRKKNRKSRKYTNEVKVEAVKMCIIDGVPHDDISSKLKVPKSIIYTWVYDARHGDKRYEEIMGDVRASEDVPYHVKKDLCDQSELTAINQSDWFIDECEIELFNELREEYAESFACDEVLKYAFSLSDTDYIKMKKYADIVLEKGVKSVFG